MSAAKRIKTSSKPENKSIASASGRYDKRIQLAIPLRVTTWDEHKKPLLDMACTLDVSMRGARLCGVRSLLKVGDVVTVERGRNKLFCRVVWIGTPDSNKKGQIGVQAVEPGKSLWEADMVEVGQQYTPITADPSTRPVGDRNRRATRVVTEAQARVLEQQDGRDGVVCEGLIKNISEAGCLLESPVRLHVGAAVKVVLDLPNFDLALRGKVRHSGPEGLGIEFREIRKGDRQLLRYWLRQASQVSQEAAAVGAS